MHEEAEKGGEQGQGLVWDARSMPQSCRLSPEGNALSFFYLFNSFFSISYHLTKKKEERKKKKNFRPIPLKNTDAKIFNKILANWIQQSRIYLRNARMIQ